MTPTKLTLELPAVVLAAVPQKWMILMLARQGRWLIDARGTDVDTTLTEWDLPDRDATRITITNPSEAARRWVTQWLAVGTYYVPEWR